MAAAERAVPAQRGAPRQPAQRPQSAGLLAVRVEPQSWPMDGLIFGRVTVVVYHDQDIEKAGRTFNCSAQTTHAVGLVRFEGGRSMHLGVERGTCAGHSHEPASAIMSPTDSQSASSTLLGREPIDKTAPSESSTALEVQPK